MATLTRPAHRLDELNPVVTCEADIEVALAELCWCDYRQRSVDTLVNAELDAIRRTKLKHYLVTPASDEQPEPLTLKQRYEKLVSAVVTFATSAKDALLASAKKGAKSREFGLGTIAYRQQPEKLKSRFAESTLDDLLQTLLDRHGLPAIVNRWLTEYSGAGLPLGDMITVSYGWNVSRIKDLVDLKKITHEQLAEIGLKIERDPERVEVKLK